MRPKTPCFSGARHSMPLIAIAPGVQHQRGAFRSRRGDRHHFRPPVRVIEPAIRKETFSICRPLSRGHRVIVNLLERAQVQVPTKTGHRSRQLHIFLKNILWACERKSLAKTHGRGNVTDDFPVWSRLTGHGQERALARDAPLGIGDCTVFFAPARSWQQHIRQITCVRPLHNVRDNHKGHVRNRFGNALRVGHGNSRIR